MVQGGAIYCLFLDSCFSSKRAHAHNMCVNFISRTSDGRASVVSQRSTRTSTVSHISMFHDEPSESALGMGIGLSTRAPIKQRRFADQLMVRHAAEPSELSEFSMGARLRSQERRHHRRFSTGALGSACGCEAVRSVRGCAHSCSTLRTLVFNVVLVFAAAIIFSYLERDGEVQRRARRALVLDALNRSCGAQLHADVLEVFAIDARSLTLDARAATSGNLQGDGDWDFAGSILYAFTVSTTIGYGSWTVHSDAGRWLTIFYALVAIPLCFKGFTALSDHVLHFLSSYCSGRQSGVAEKVCTREDNEKPCVHVHACVHVRACVHVKRRFLRRSPPLPPPRALASTMGCFACPIALLASPWGQPRSQPYTYTHRSST